MARMKQLLIAGGTVIGVALIASQLGGADEPQAASTPTSTASVSAVAVCVDLGAGVADGLAQATDATAASNAGAVKSPVSETWIVAVEMKDGPMAGEVAVFETDNITQGGSTRGVDGFAHEFTGFPESAFTVADDVYDEAKSCME